MSADAMSLCSSQGSEERSVAIHLMLTTFAGKEIQLSIDLQEYDRLNEFENAVLNQLPYLGDNSACSLSTRTPIKCWLTPFGAPCETITVSM